MFLTKLSSCPVSLSEPPMIGINPTAKANKTVGRSVKAEMNGRAISLNGMVKIAKMNAPENMAAAKFFLETISKTANASKNPVQTKSEAIKLTQQNMYAS